MSGADARHLALCCAAGLQAADREDLTPAALARPVAAHGQRSTTERLVLRPFRGARRDAEFARLAGDWAVASHDERHPLPLLRAAQAMAWLQAGARRGAVRHRARRPADRRRRLLPPAARARPSSASGWGGRGGATATPRKPRAPSCATGLPTRRLPGFYLLPLRRQPGLGARACQARLRAVGAAASPAPRAATTWRPSPTGSTGSVPGWRCRCPRRRAAALARLARPHHRQPATDPRP